MARFFSANHNSLLRIANNGRFPFNKNYRFKFSEFSLVEWNASDRFPGFAVTCPATQGMLGDHLLSLKMADFLNIFAALEQDKCEITSCTIEQKPKLDLTTWQNGGNRTTDERKSKVA